jgi:hypothetical protein
MPQPRWTPELRGRSGTARCRADGPLAAMRRFGNPVLDRVERDA